jgi:hypothetical protein
MLLFRIAALKRVVTAAVVSELGNSKRLFRAHSRQTAVSSTFTGKQTDSTD